MATACGDIVIVVSKAFVPSLSDVFVWHSLLISVLLVMRLNEHGVQVCVSSRAAEASSRPRGTSIRVLGA